MFIALLFEDGFTEEKPEGRYRVFGKPWFGEFYYVRQDGRIRLGMDFLRSRDVTDQRDWKQIKRLYMVIAWKNHTRNQSPYPGQKVD